jgi:Fe-S cluster assembly protein SufD
MFQGLVEVSHDGKGSRAKQLNKNLLMSDGAIALTKPQLRIDHNDVKCQHGATVTKVSDLEVFYLKSRGLTHAQAEQLLVMAFLSVVAEEFGDKKQLSSWVAAKLGKMKGAL